MGDRLHYIVGTYLENSDPGQPVLSRALEFGPPPSLKSIPQLYNPLVLANSVLNYHKFNDKSESAFVHGEYDLSNLVPGLKADAGFRYTWDERQASSISSTVLGRCVTRTQIFAVNGKPVCFDSERAEFTAPTWSATLSEQFDDKTLAYVTLRRGYKSGGFNCRRRANWMAPCSTSLWPEYVFDTEVGLKKDWSIGERGGAYQSRGVPRRLFEHSGIVRDGRRGHDRLRGAERRARAYRWAGSRTNYPADAEPAGQRLFLAAACGVFHPVRAGRGGTEGHVFVLLADPEIRGQCGAVAAAVGPVGLAGADRGFQPVDALLDADPLDPMAYFKGQENLNMRLDWDHVGGKPVGLAFIATNVLNKTYAIGGYPIYGLAGVSDRYLQRAAYAVGAAYCELGAWG
ncbi:MAG: hypothetical protein WDN04_07025 [Rhodospirillales bacterium]